MVKIDKLDKMTKFPKVKNKKVPKLQKEKPEIPDSERFKYAPEAQAYEYLQSDDAKIIAEKMRIVRENRNKK